MSVLFESGAVFKCHSCDELKETRGGSTLAGYLGIVVWYCAECYRKSLEVTK